MFSRRRTELERVERLIKGLRANGISRAVAWFQDKIGNGMAYIGGEAEARRWYARAEAIRRDIADREAQADCLEADPEPDKYLF